MDILAAIGIVATLLAFVGLVIVAAGTFGKVFDTARDTDRLRKEIEKAKDAHNELFDRVNALEVSESAVKPSKAK
jgi:beta-lactam-binding protein with PASTA domain